MAFEEVGADAEIDEGRGADLETIRHAAALRVDVEAKFPLGVLGGKVNLTLGGFDALGGHDEVVNEFLHTHHDALFLGERRLGIDDVDVAFGHGFDHLTDDLDRLTNFFHSDEIAVVAITVFRNGDIELVFLVAEIRAVPAKVTVDATGAQIWPRHAVADGVFFADHSDITHALEVDLVLVEKSGNFAHRCFAFVEELKNILIESFGKVADLAADAGVGSGESRSGDFLTEVVDFFALGEGVEEDGHRADVHGANAHSQHVGGNAGQFAAKNA